MRWCQEVARRRKRKRGSNRRGDFFPVSVQRCSYGVLRLSWIVRSRSVGRGVVVVVQGEVRIVQGRRRKLKENRRIDRSVGELRYCDLVQTREDIGARGTPFARRELDYTGDPRIAKILPVYKKGERACRDSIGHWFLSLSRSLSCTSIASSLIFAQVESTGASIFGN